MQDDYAYYPPVENILLWPLTNMCNVTSNWKIMRIYCDVVFTHTMASCNISLYNFNNETTMKMTVIFLKSSAALQSAIVWQRNNYLQLGKTTLDKWVLTRFTIHETLSSRYFPIAHNYLVLPTRIIIVTFPTAGWIHRELLTWREHEPDIRSRTLDLFSEVH